MRKGEWREIVKKDMQDSGTYQRAFDSVIDTFSQILETRDAIIAEYEAGGRKVVVEHIAKDGSVNMAQNPALLAIRTQEKLISKYIRELGLSPVSYHRIRG